MTHLTFLSAVLSRLSEVRFPDLSRVAEGAGVPESTVRKLRYGEVKNPRVQTVQALHDYFARTDGATHPPAREDAMKSDGEPGQEHA